MFSEVLSDIYPQEIIPQIGNDQGIGRDQGHQVSGQAMISRWLKSEDQVRVEPDTLQLSVSDSTLS